MKRRITSPKKLVSPVINDASRQLSHNTGRPTEQLRTDRGTQGDTPKPNKFLIAALGASAGGLESLETFFRHMPSDAGIAFVVVMHLSPDHTSALPELLARCTRMTVEQVRGDTRVVADCVYIIPPNASLTFSDCTLHVSTPVEPRGRRMAIDNLFRSLAEDQGENAACIVLSGSGTDGTIGIRAVKEHGGLVMAQTLQSAKYDAMLRSAIDTNLVDYVLAVEEMPAKLIAYAASSNLHDGPNQPGDISEQTKKFGSEIYDLLRRRVGHDFSGYKDGTVSRRINRRMKALKIETPERYVELLERQPEEVDLLFKDLLIGVTAFFRDPEAFETLGREVIPKIFEGREAGAQIRACVVGCSSGEEVYSIAILLLEHAATLKNAPEIKIFATDIDERALEVARKGLYPEGIAKQVSAERLDRFFIRQVEGYQVKRDLREICFFSRHSFISDPPYSRLDLISCRNLLIYLGENLQQKIFQLFHYALRSGGFLFLGKSESVTGRDLFRSVKKKQRIFQKKDTLPLSLVAFPLLHTQPSKLPGVALSAEDRTLPRRLERIILKRYAPACVVVNDSGGSLYFSGDVSRYLEQPAGNLDTNVVSMAREGLRIPLRTALRKAVTTHKPVIQKQIAARLNGEAGHIDLSVEPLAEFQEASLYIVVLSEAPLRKGLQPEEVLSGAGSSEETIRQLEGELRAAQEQAQAIFEELETSNEELRSANEEYQSTNEELDTSREELQSFNEELETVNTELNGKVAELDTVNGDLQNLLNNTRIATVFLDSELHIRNFTSAAGDIFHFIGTDIGRPIADLAGNLTGMNLVADAREVLETHSPLERQVVETGRFYQGRILPYRTVSNIISGVVVTLTDVTKIRQAEQAAHQAKAYAESIVDAVREPLIVLDGSLRVASASQAFYRMFQVSAEETLTKSLFDLGNRQWDIPEFRDLLNQVLPMNQKFDDYQLEGEFPNLGRRTMLLNGRRLEQGDGKDPLLLLAIEDITERTRAPYSLRASELPHCEDVEILPIARDITGRKRLEQERRDLEERERSMAAASELHKMEAELARVARALTVGELATSIAHEVSQPLTGIVTNAETCLRWLSGTEPNLAEAQESLVRIVQDGKRASEIVRRIRRFLTRESHEMSTLELNSVVGEVVEMARQELFRRQVRLRVDLSDDLPFVRADRIQLQQVLLNLIMNATDAMASTVEKSRELLLTASESDTGGILVALQDSGVGLDPENIDRIFDAFFTTKPSGMGMGLSISRSIIEAHGGRIWAEPNDGPGVTIQFSLPAEGNLRHSAPVHLHV